MNTFFDNIQVDFHSDEPLFLQIARQVQQLVLSGTLKPGDQLPTVRELATELRINFNTVARAYRLLEESRLISTQRGRGTYIWETPSPEVANSLRQQSLAAIARRYLEETRRLGFTSAEASQALEDAIHSSSPEPDESINDRNGSQEKS